MNQMRFITSDDEAFFRTWLSPESVQYLDHSLATALELKTREATEASTASVKKNLEKLAKLVREIDLLLDEQLTAIIEKELYARCYPTTADYFEASDETRTHVAMEFISLKTVKESLPLLASLSEDATKYLNSTRGRKVSGPQIIIAWELRLCMAREQLEITDSNDGNAAKMLHRLFERAGFHRADVRNWIQDWMIHPDPWKTPPNKKR